LTTEKDDEIQNDQQQEDKGTEFDGLQVILSLLFHISLKIQSKLKKKDEDGRGDTDRTENIQNDDKEDVDSSDLKNDEMETNIEDEERNEEPTESVEKVEQKLLASETNDEEKEIEKKEMEQLFAHSKSIEKCTEKTVDRAEDEKFENQEVQ